jgi:hypothetical protein
VYAASGDVKTALAHAERAAIDSRAGWAIRPTIQYAMRLKDKEKSALWQRRLAGVEPFP